MLACPTCYEPRVLDAVISSIALCTARFNHFGDNWVRACPIYNALHYGHTQNRGTAGADVPAGGAGRAAQGVAAACRWWSVLRETAQAIEKGE